MKRYHAIADFYDAENARYAMLERDVPFFLGQIPRRGQDILELATGTARAAIPLAQAGHRVVGVDYADDMLALARRKRDAVGLTEKQLALAPGDILTLDLGRRFDWVCVFFNTFLAFTTLDEQDLALQTIVRHLKPRGRLWLDVFNPEARIAALEDATGLDPGVFYVPASGRTVYTTTEVRRGDRPQVRRLTTRYAWFDSDGHERRRKIEFDLTFHFPRELQLLLERNGFRVERLFGDYGGGDVTPNSPRLIARCCRA